MKRFKWAILLLAGISLLAAARLGIQKSEWFGQTATPAAGTSGTSAVGAAAAIASLPADAKVVFGDWSYVGPTNFSGAAQDIVVDPYTGDLYALSREGWIFKSSDNGGTWTLVVRYDAPLPATRLEIQRDGASIEAFLMVWEGNGYIGNLVRIKPDGSSATIQYYPRQVKAIGGRLYATTSNGLQTSDDDGATWAYVALGASQEAHMGCWDIEVSGTSVYVMCSKEHYAGAFSLLEVHRSVNGGQFTKVWTMPDSYPTGQFGKDKWATLGRLAVSPSNPNVVYASYAQNAKFDGGAHVFRSTDGGTSWELRTDPNGSNPFNASLLHDFDARCSGTSASTNASYVLEVDPVDPDVVWIGNLELYRSDDGGLNFGRASLDSDKGHEVYHLPRGVRAIRFSKGFNGGSDRNMYVATTQGVFVATNARAAVQTSPATSCANAGTPPAMAWQLRANGYTTVSVDAVDVDPTGEVLATLGSEGAAGLYQGHLDDPESWTRLSKEIPKQVSIDPTRGMDRYFTSKCQGARLCRWDWNSMASAWTVTANVLDDPNYESIDSSVFVRDPANPSRYWAGNGRTVLRSDDGMATWTPAGFTGWTNVVTGAVSPANPNLVLLASSEGTIYRNANALAANGNTYWSFVYPADIVWYASSIVFDPNRPQNVYTTGPAPYWILVSKDGGLNWTRAAPSSGVGALTMAVDPVNSDVLYVGKQDGLFVSWDRTATTTSAWYEVSTPFAGEAIKKLVLRRTASGNKLYAFTAGRGIWAASVTVQRFTDVPLNYWASDYIERLAHAGITTGCASNPPQYCPTGTVTRDQMAVFLLRASHGSTYQPPAATGDFADVPTSYWAAAWIEQLREEGITTGCASNPLQYCPGSPVTREQMAVFLLRARYGASYVPPPATGVFADVPTSHWAAAWIEKLASDGVTSGCSAQPMMYCPSSTVTRDQMAAFLVRAFGP